MTVYDLLTCKLMCSLCVLSYWHISASGNLFCLQIEGMHQSQALLQALQSVLLLCGTHPLVFLCERIPNIDLCTSISLRRHLTFDDPRDLRRVTINIYLEKVEHYGRHHVSVKNRKGYIVTIIVT